MNAESPLIQREITVNVRDSKFQMVYGNALEGSLAIMPIAMEVNRFCRCTPAVTKKIKAAKPDLSTQSF